VVDVSVVGSAERSGGDVAEASVAPPSESPPLHADATTAITHATATSVRGAYRGRLPGVVEGAIRGQRSCLPTSNSSRPAADPAWA